jgi:hypothetical protein
VQEIIDFVALVAEYFDSRLGHSLVEAYKLGSLAHGGFSSIYSDIDLGLLLRCANPPAEMDRLIAAAKALHADYGRKLSVFWGNPECGWGRLPVIDRLDLLDHGVPLLRQHKPAFDWPARAEIRRALRDSLEKSYLSRLPELGRLDRLEPQNRKPYIRALLYPARLIYTWDNLAVDSNDRAVEYLHQVQPPRLDLRSIAMALACRRGHCSADEVFARAADLNRQFEASLAYISERRE